MRHDGVVLDACNKIRKYGVGYPKLDCEWDKNGEVVAYDDKEEFLEEMYEALEKDSEVKVVCYTNNNVHKVNNEVHKRRNPGCDLPFVEGEHIMSARAIQQPGLNRVLCPSSMDMKVLECYADQLDLGMKAASERILGMQAVRALLGTEGDHDVYRCHCVGAEYDGYGILFHVFNNHKGEEKRFQMTQEFLKGYADDRTRDRDIRQALNRYINWREDHFASVHLSTAMTVHKSQGSSFKEVWVYPDIPNRNDKMSNSLAYVAASRAKKRLVVCN
jgi:ATP-dependent exoDNAse (exonuclease V) alpha subunit